MVEHHAQYGKAAQLVHHVDALRPGGSVGAAGRDRPSLGIGEKKVPWAVCHSFSAAARKDWGEGRSRELGCPPSRPSAKARRCAESDRIPPGERAFFDQQGTIRENRFYAIIIASCTLPEKLYHCNIITYFFAEINEGRMDMSEIKPERSSACKKM